MLPDPEDIQPDLIGVLDLFQQVAEAIRRTADHCGLAHCRRKAVNAYLHVEASTSASGRLFQSQQLAACHTRRRCPVLVNDGQRAAFDLDQAGKGASEMNADLLNLVLWGVQGFLALFFVAAGTPKLLGRGIERWTGFSDLSRPLVVFIGFTELLGAAGLVLPMATGILPWLTPLAAVGLAITVLMAAGFHTRADERLAALETALWASVAMVVAVGRWDLVASRAEIPPWLVIGALAVLVPSAIINVIVLVRRPVHAGATGPGPARDRASNERRRIVV
jgi:hypothetical protein